jgi:hypothetical protein
MTSCKVEVWVGDFDFYTYYLGSCEIAGRPGLWRESSCRLDLSDISLWSFPGAMNTRWDLQLLFFGPAGQSLCEVSQFWFGADRPAAAEKLVPEVMTGKAGVIQAGKVTIAGNSFREFDDLEVSEFGVMFSLSEDFIPCLYLPVSLTAISQPEFSVTCQTLELYGPGFYRYRAYVKTATGFFFGGTKLLVIH